MLKPILLCHLARAQSTSMQQTCSWHFMYDKSQTTSSKNPAHLEIRAINSDFYLMYLNHIIKLVTGNLTFIYYKFYTHFLLTMTSNVFFQSDMILIIAEKAQCIMNTKAVESDCHLHELKSNYTNWPFYRCNDLRQFSAQD